MSLALLSYHIKKKLINYTTSLRRIRANPYLRELNPVIRRPRIQPPQGVLVIRHHEPNLWHSDNQPPGNWARAGFGPQEEQQRGGAVSSAEGEPCRRHGRSGRRRAGAWRQRFGRCRRTGRQSPARHPPRRRRGGAGRGGGGALQRGLCGLGFGMVDLEFWGRNVWGGRPSFEENKP